MSEGYRAQVARGVLLAPISAATWFVGRRFRKVVSRLSATARYWADLASGHACSNAFIGL